ncbi:MAG: signal recognition particle protein Srp54 [Candidatus Bathyarchaeia archaeon]
MSAIETLGRSLSDAVRRILRLPVIDEKAVKELVKDLQRILLAADVDVNLVLQISKNIEARSLKEKLPPGISRREHVIKVLYEELTKLLGEKPAKLDLEPGKANIIMLVGIQGSGKTTGTVKLARFYQKRGMRPAIICTDTFRPGAFDQLKQLADKIGIATVGPEGVKEPEKIAERGLKILREKGFDTIIIDTAGRHKNEKDLMEEMRRLSETIRPNEIILVIDGTIGQQAATQASAFNQTTPIGSIYVTKLDGSAKGGGAISAVAATGAKIKFIGIGEGIDDIEQFTPAKFVGRLLGMGDIQSLVERVREAELSLSKSRTKEILRGKFTLKDMYEQMEAVRKMGPLRKIWSMIPGGYNIPEEMADIAEKRFDSWRVIIQSMNREEIENPKIIDSSRIRRIARGSGRSEKDVKELLDQYGAMRRMLKLMKRRQPAMLRKLQLQS